MDRHNLDMQQTLSAGRFPKFYLKIIIYLVFRINLKLVYKNM